MAEQAIETLCNNKYLTRLETEIDYFKIML